METTTNKLWIALCFAIIVGLSVANGEMLHNESGVTIDTNTKLMWQDKTVRKNWQGAMDYCENLNLAGYTDWKLPDKNTLEVLYKNQQAGLRNISGVYWSSSSVDSDSSGARHVDFDYGRDYWSGKSLSYLVRCVRDSNFDTLNIKKEASQKEMFQIEGGVTLDTETKLLWQDNEEAKTIKKDWQGAIDYCENLKLAGYTDWRLPDIDILKALYPKRDDLQNVASGYYWANSTYTDSKSNAWHVGFNGVYDYTNGKNSYYLVRCVRDGNFDTSAIQNSKNLKSQDTLTVKTILKVFGKDGIIFDSDTKQIWQDNEEAKTIKKIGKVRLIIVRI